MPMLESAATALPPPAPAVPDASLPAQPALPPPPTPPRPGDYLANPKPPYPSLSRRLGEEGIVRLNILVNPDGSVARLEVAKSSGYPRLDASAMKTVQSNWKFEPARQAGKPVPPGSLSRYSSPSGVKPLETTTQPPQLGFDHFIAQGDTLAHVLLVTNYDGGELVIGDGMGGRSVKLPQDI